MKFTSSTKSSTIFWCIVDKDSSRDTTRRCVHQEAESQKLCKGRELGRCTWIPMNMIYWNINSFEEQESRFLEGI